MRTSQVRNLGVATAGALLAVAGLTASATTVHAFRPAGQLRLTISADQGTSPITVTPDDDRWNVGS